MISFILGIIANLLIFVTPAYADSTSHGSLETPEVIIHLQEQGYTSIEEIVLNHNSYEAIVITAENKITKLFIDAETNEIYDSKPIAKNGIKFHPAKLTMLEAVKKVEEAGYHHIYHIELIDGKYKVKALYKNEVSTELNVDGNTGVLKKKWWFN